MQTNAITEFSKHKVYLRRRKRKTRKITNLHLYTLWVYFFNIYFL